MAAGYYIRNRGRRLGPLSLDKLHAMAKRGRFGRHFEVSTDGKRWARADDFPELFSSDLTAIDADPDEDFGSDEEEVSADPYAPIVDEVPAGGRRPRKKWTKIVQR